MLYNREALQLARDNNCLEAWGRILIERISRKETYEGQEGAQGIPWTEGRLERRRRSRRNVEVRINWKVVLRRSLETSEKCKVSLSTAHREMYVQWLQRVLMNGGHSPFLDISCISHPSSTHTNSTQSNESSNCPSTSERQKLFTNFHFRIFSHIYLLPIFAV